MSLFTQPTNMHASPEVASSSNQSIMGQMEEKGRAFRSQKTKLSACDIIYNVLSMHIQLEVKY